MFSELMALIITTKKNLLNTCMMVKRDEMLWLVQPQFIHDADEIFFFFNNFEEKFLNLFISL